jgi:hypothetical protein
LLVNQNYRADVVLSLGTLTERVEVSAAPVQVEATSAQLGDVISDTKMLALPLNGRSYIELLGLQPGVNPIDSTTGHVTDVVSGDLSQGQQSINGNREDANYFMVNGVSVEDVGGNGADIIPVLDSLQEFRVLTDAFGAEYGQYSGGIINVITKSGTNQFHGDLFEFLRNDDLDARNFFALTTPVFKQSQFGGTIGGPILKNRLFFFGATEITRQVQGITTSVVSVPSAAERSGDFSGVEATGFPSLTGTVLGDTTPTAMPAVLSSRLGYTVSPGEPYWTPGCTTTAECVFPGEVIPQTAWSTPAKDLLRFIPLPTGVSNGTPVFSTSGLATHLDDEKWSGRVDFNTQRTGTWSGYYTFDQASVNNPFGFADVPGFPASTPSRAQAATVSNTLTISPTQVNEASLGWNRYADPGPLLTANLGSPSNFGFTVGGLGINPSIASLEAIPSTNLGLLGVNFGSTGSQEYYQAAISANDNYTFIRGKHTLKMGGMFQYIQWNRRASADPNGAFTFDGTETGNDFADFLIGAPSTYIQGAQSLINTRGKAGALFIQDSWKLKPNLTVTPGLRWDVSQPWYDEFNMLQGWIQGEQSEVYPNSPAGYLFPGDPGVPRTLSPTKYDKFAPRLGVAYSPSNKGGVLGKLFGGPGKSSLRGAFGIFYQSLSTEGSNYATGDPPFGIYWVSPTPVYYQDPFESRASANDNPGQRFPVVFPPSRDESFASFQPISGSPMIPPDNTRPYAVEYNLSFQRQIGSSTLLTLAYVGTQSHHLFSQIEMNPGNPAKCLQIAALASQAGLSGEECGPFGEDTIYNINGQTFDGTRPFSVTSGRYLSQGLLDFSDNTLEATLANSNYNALQASLNKRVGALRFLASYTWSKSLDNASGFFELINPYNPRASKALSSFDMPQDLTVSYFYDLPFRRLTSSSSGVLHGFLAGWQLAGISTFTTGTPVDLTESGDDSLCGCDSLGTPAVQVPNWNGQPLQFYNARSQPGNQWFSTSGFSPMQLGVGGNASRRFFTGPGLVNTDLALGKDTRIKEHVTLQIRAEFFNIFNHTQFTNPVGNISSPLFGDVTGANNPRIGQVAAKIIF